MDQGSECVSHDVDLSPDADNVTLDFSRPGKPTDNAYIEAFNGRFWAVSLNMHWFLTPSVAREEMGPWLRYCNEESLHGATGDTVPWELQNPDAATSLPSWPSRKTPTLGGPSIGR